LVTRDLLDHVAYVQGGHIVEELRDCRFNKAQKHWTILVKWMGSSEADTMWEPVTNLVEDVPVLVPILSLRAAMKRTCVKWRVSAHCQMTLESFWGR
jgi:hypothetical protein